MAKESRQAGAVDVSEIEVTPEMIKAGADAARNYCHLNVSYSEDEILFIVKSILSEAMGKQV